MSYTYDNTDNVTTITDALAGPQTQEFTYNAADMVTQASAAGGTDGLYSENHSYSSGNLYNKGGVTNTYGDTAHPHAVKARSNGNTYVYDDNGNQTRREIGNDTYDMKYDAENRLVEVKKNRTVIATFVYDGDGKQVKGTMNGATTYYVGAYYQKQGTLVTKYYYAGAERVAMRQGGVLYYIFGDHLGSTAVVKNTQGGKTELRYTAWGTTRYEYGSTPTDRRYTGQREEDSLGLYFYNARWYDPALGRFIQADTIVPGAGNPQAWDRYAYANNNPANSTDPTGHKACDDVDNYGKCITEPIEKKDPEPPQPPQPPVSPGDGYYPSLNPNPPTISSWDTPSKWDLDPQNPDYFTLVINADLPTILPIGVSFLVTMDRYNQWYLGGGGNIGRSYGSHTFVLTGGFAGSPFDDDMPDPVNLSNFLNGVYVNGGMGFLSGFSVSWSPSSWSPILGDYSTHFAGEGGIFLPPSLGISLVYMRQIR
jgi:RHS repeat-associated protein